MSLNCPVGAPEEDNKHTGSLHSRDLDKSLNCLVWAPGKDINLSKKSLHVVAPSSVLGRRKSTLNWPTLLYTITTLLYFGTAVMPKIWENFSCVFITLHYLGRHYSTLLYLGFWDFGDKLGEKVVSPGRRRLLGM